MNPADPERSPDAEPPHSRPPRSRLPPPNAAGESAVNRPETVFRHAIGWVTLWGFWVVVSRLNHPNLRLNLIASGLLVATFAAAVYLNHALLIPRLWRRRRHAAYGSALLIGIALLSLACTAAIHVVYELLWGPDPMRFGFWANLGMEFGLVSIHVTAIPLFARLGRSVDFGRAGSSGPGPNGSRRNGT